MFVFPIQKKYLEIFDGAHALVIWSNLPVFHTKPVHILRQSGDVSFQLYSLLFYISKCYPTFMHYLVFHLCVVGPGVTPTLVP